MSFLKSKHNGWLSDGTRTPFSGGGSGGGGGPTQTTAYNTNIPEYARPYVENMLQSTQAQIYNDDMTGFRPYQPYSSDVNQYFAGFSPLQQSAQQSAYYMQAPGQYDLASGLAGAAGIGALGAQDQSSFLGSQALGYGQAGQTYGDVGQMYGAQGAQQAQMAAQQAQQQAQRYGMGAVRTGQQALGYGAQGAGYGAGAAGLGLSAAELAAQQGLGYGAQGAGFGAQAAGLAGEATGAGRAMGDIGAFGGAQAGTLAGGVAGQAMGYGAQAAQAGNLGLTTGQAMAGIGAQGLGYGALGAGYGGRGAQAAEQGFGAGEAFARQATSPEATAAYMSPYMQNVVDYQKSQALRNYEMAVPYRAAKAVGSGAFGGSRQAIESAEAQRGLMSQLQGIEATGAQKAFEDAQRQQQFGAQLGVQGLQAGYGGLGLGMQGAGVGLSGLGTALQGQQGQLAGLGAYQQGLQGAQAGLGQALSAGQLGLAGTQQALAGQQGVLAGLQGAGQLYGQGMQGAGIGLQGLQGALAGSAQGLQGYQAGMQGAQTGMQGVQGALQGYQTGLSGVGQQLGAGQLGLAGTAQGIQGAQAGMQGAGYGLQGVQGATQAGQYGLAGLGQATQAAGALGQLGTAQLGAEQSIANLQSTMGAQQQAAEQAKINQAIQDYAIQQQYPMMQLGFMSNMLRGLPMQAQTTQLYQAQPSALQQGAGLIGAGASLFGGRAEGGVIKMAEGGIAGYKYGGAIPEAKLSGMADNLSVQQLQERIKDPALTPGERQIFQEALAAKQQVAARSEGIAAAGGGLFNTMGYAGGGILAFADEGLVDTGIDPETGEPYKSVNPFDIGRFARKGQSIAEYYKETPKGKEPTEAERKAQAQMEVQDIEGSSAKVPTRRTAAAAPSTGSQASKAPSAQAAEVSGLGSILAGLRKEGPQGELGADYLDKLKALESGAGERLSKADRLAMAKGFLKFGATPAPGGIGQAAIAGLGEYAEGYGKAVESAEKFKLEMAKMQNDVQNLRRAEERGDVKLAAELQEKIADRQNRLQTANISAASAGKTGAREDAYIKQLMAQGMTLEQALQAVKGAGRAEANDIARIAKADAALAGDANYLRYSMSKKPEDQAKAEQIKAQKYREYGIGVGGSMQTSGGGVPKDIQGILNKYQ